MIGTIEELRLLIKDAAMRRPHLTGRLEKAAFLVLLRPIECLGTGSLAGGLRGRAALLHRQGGGV